MASRQVSSSASASKTRSGSKKRKLAKSKGQTKTSLPVKKFLDVFDPSARSPDNERWPDRVPPVWLMRQAGRYLPEYRETRKQAGDFLTLCYTPELAAEVTLQPIRRYGFDAAILFSDILVVPDALGQPVRFETGEGPRLDPLKTGADIAALDLERAAPVFDRIYQTVRILARELPKQTALIGFCGAPFTVATYMIDGKGSKDQAGTRLFAYKKPKLFARLMDLLVDASEHYLLGQIEAGAEAIQIFDSWAGNLPENEFKRWVTRPTAELVKRLKARYPDVPVIGFPRGAGPLYREFVRGTGVDAVSCDTALPVSWIKRNLQSRVVVQGNLDPLLLIKGGQALERRARQICKLLGSGPHIFNLGHGITPDVPPDNVQRLLDTIRR